MQNFVAFLNPLLKYLFHSEFVPMNLKTENFAAKTSDAKIVNMYAARYVFWKRRRVWISLVVSFEV